MRTGYRRYLAWGIYLSVFVVLTICSSLMIQRVGYAPDQGSHQRVAQNFTAHVFFDARELWMEGAERGHGYNLFSAVPYSLYALSGALLKNVLFEDCARCELVAYRVGGLLYGLLQFVAFGLLAREIFGRRAFDQTNSTRRLCALCFAAALVAVPQLTVLHSYVNADSYTIFVSSLCVLVGLRLFLQRSPIKGGLWHYLAFGLLISGLMHAKDSAYPMAFPLMLGACAALVRSRSRINLRGLLLAFLVAAFVGGSYRFAVYRELGNGELLAGPTHLELMRSTSQGAGMFDYMSDAVTFQQEGSNTSRAEAVAEGLRRLKPYRGYIWATTWGDLTKVGSLPDGMLYLIACLSAASIIGWFGSVVVSFLKYNKLRYRRLRLLRRRFGIFVTLCSFVCFFSTSIPLVLQPVVIQGRLLLPALPLYGPILIFGLAFYFNLFGASRRAAVLCSSIVWCAIFLYGNVLLAQLLLRLPMGG